jgi:hypothetical protein
MLTRRGRFYFGIAFGVFWYLLHCDFNSNAHPGVPWYETGFYFGGPKGFPVVIVAFALAFVQLFFRKD